MSMCRRKAHRGARALQTAVLILLLQPCANSQSNDASLLEFISQQQEAAQSRVRSYTLEVTKHSKTTVREPGSEVPAVVESRRSYDILRSGINIRSMYEVEQRSEQLSLTPHLETRVVSNEMYTACWPHVGSSQILVQDQQPVAAAVDRVAMHLNSAEPVSFLDVGFGFGKRNTSFRAVRSTYPDSTQWTIDQEVLIEGNSVYVVRAVNSGGENPVIEAVADPALGYLFTTTVLREPTGSGAIVEILRTTIKAESKGIFFPVKHERQYWESGNRTLNMNLADIVSERAHERILECPPDGYDYTEVTKLELNRAVDQEHFTWHALQPKDGDTEIVWQDAMGAESIYKSVGGKLLAIEPVN